MNSGRVWVGETCCFILFLTLCILLVLNMKCSAVTVGDPDIGLLFFTLPGAIASYVSRPSRVLRPLLGAVVAAACSLLLIRLFFTTPRSFWQDLAWLFSAVFWCGLGALFISAILHGKRRRRR
ncbi:MAG TPA: inner membrane protein YbjM [Enterobacteriaceae bacterium]|nr:inner membrane protein YbjM [Enterobacteriaceae bacterium]